MNKYLRNIYLNIFGYYQKPAPSVHILNSHFVSRTNPNKKTFFDLLNNINRFCTFITLNSAINKIEAGFNNDAVYVSFTFDDGFEECYTIIAPALEKHNCRGCFFINPGFVNGNQDYIQDFTLNKVLTRGKKPMTWEMIKDLHERGHIIGSHTVDHIRLNTVDPNILKYQIIDSKHIIEDILGAPCHYFAYPYGQLKDISEVALKIAVENYKYIFSGCNYLKYYSCDGRVFNRRHIEGDWSINHVRYFLSKKRT